MMLIFSGRKRIKDRHIRWKEHYPKRSRSLKKKFDKMLPGSYFRWQGFDHETGHPYYVVVGPAVSERHGKSFFAGIKKMPKDPRKIAYSPSGEYFESLRSALSHASEMWGIQTPKNAGNYRKQDLLPLSIPRHVKG